MTKPIMLLTAIPFSGFYHSVWSDEIERQQESYAEYEAEYRQDENGIPEALHLDDRELNDILYDVTDYSAAYSKVARDYADAFNTWASEQLEIESIGLQFESMESPRFYNFRTDRIFCHIPLKVVRALFKLSAAEGHSRLRDVIRGRFTSRDGFISGYPNDLETWLEKPVRDWDHNEIETLIIALAGEPDDINDVYYRMGDEWGYQAFESAVDWQRYEERAKELRAEKLAQWIIDNPEAAAQWATHNSDSFADIMGVNPSQYADLESALAAIPYRCQKTADLFNGGW